MLTTLVSLLLASSPPQTFLEQPHPDDDCEANRHLELSLPVLTPPRICVSAGTLTGMVFHQPVTVELQEEVRFIEVLRGREVVGFIPPRDMLPGEQLRLTAVLGTGERRQSLTFVLVAHPGQGSHQVDVNGSERNWQSMNDALAEALLTNRSLSARVEALEAEATRTRAQAAQPTGLCAAYAGGQLGDNGITSRQVFISEESASTIMATWVMGYRGHLNVAVKVSIKNRTQQPWILEEATLINARGETLKALRFQQTEAIAPGEKRPVFVEFDPSGFTPNGATLMLTGTGDRVLPIPNVVFP